MAARTQPRTGKLELDPATVARARGLAERAGQPIVDIARQHTTVAVERATLRLAGLAGADADGTPWVNRRWAGPGGQGARAPGRQAERQAGQAERRPLDGDGGVPPGDVDDRLAGAFGEAPGLRDGGRVELELAGAGLGAGRHQSRPSKRPRTPALLRSRSRAYAAWPGR